MGRGADVSTVQSDRLYSSCLAAPPRGFGRQIVITAPSGRNRTPGRIALGGPSSTTDCIVIRGRGTREKRQGLNVLEDFSVIVPFSVPRSFGRTISIGPVNSPATPRHVAASSVSVPSASVFMWPTFSLSPSSRR